MYCSTCGAYITDGASRCSECGADRPRGPEDPGGHLVSRRERVRFGREDARWVQVRRVGRCPRCGYRGEGIGYFSRGSHAAALIGITILTAGAMGAGGLIYFLIRREHLVCPRCGLSWGKHGEQSHSPVLSKNAPSSLAPVPPASREWSRRTSSLLLFLLAAIMTIIGVAEVEVVPFLIAGFSAAGAILLNRSANHERARRRAALIGALQLPVLRLAREHGGRLTVTDVASALGWPMSRAEKVLNSLDDGLRVDSEVTNEGVIVYQFIELIHARSPRTQRVAGEGRIHRREGPGRLGGTPS